MFWVPISDEQITYSTNLVNSSNFGVRYYANGSKSDQLSGIISEVVIQDIFNRPRANGGIIVPGVDLVVNGKNIDVKSQQTKYFPHENCLYRIIECQINQPADAYIFCNHWQEKKILIVAGWISKKQFIANTVVWPAGSFHSLNYVNRVDERHLFQRELNQVESAIDLRDQVSRGDF